MSKSNENSKKQQLEKVQKGDLNNLVLDGMTQKVTWQMRWDNTQDKPVTITVEFDFDGVVLGRLIDESAIKHLKVVFAQRYKPEFASVEDFKNRVKKEQTAKVADLLSPMARKEMTNFDKGISAAHKMEAAELKEFMADLERIAAAKAKGND